MCFPFSFQNAVFSQISFDHYIDVGNNNVSQGVYTDFSTRVLVQSGSNRVSSGALLSFSNAQKNIFSAYFLSFSREIYERNHPINIEGFYLCKPFSEDLREFNVGFIADYRNKHFGFNLGFNSRLYSFTRAAKLKYNIPDSVSTRVWVPINLMYQLSYFQPLNKKMLLEVRVTDFNTYTILQETNPMILTKFTYTLNDKIQFYSELCYMQAGLLNIRVNYFGYYLRGGVLWQIK